MTNHQLSKSLKGCNELDVTISGIENHIKDLTKRIKSQTKRMTKTSCNDRLNMLNDSVTRLTKCLNVIKAI